jgi:hypothetical protein
MADSEMLLPAGCPEKQSQRVLPLASGKPAPTFKRLWNFVTTSEGMAAKHGRLKHRQNKAFVNFGNDRNS